MSWTIVPASALGHKREFLDVRFFLNDVLFTPKADIDRRSDMRW